ncbi:MAG TPA: CPBP family intramembrane glutamic endopeptidase [Candidatus Saccharimonadales bacterium]
MATTKTTARKTSAQAAASRQSMTAKAAAKKIVAQPKVAKNRGQTLSKIYAAVRPVRALTVLRQNWGLALGSAVMLGASQLSLWWKPALGVYVNAGAFAALCGLALWRESYRKFAISLAILPVATMITLSLPQSSNFAEAVVFYDALLLLTLVYRFWFTLDEPLPNTALTGRGYALTLPLMLIVGQVLGTAGYFMLRNYYPYEPTSLPLVAASSVVFAIAEEMLFRGLIQQRAAKIMHPVVAAALSAALYTFASVGHSTLLVPLFALLSGIVLSFTYYKKQNLLLTITINAMSKLAYIGLLATFTLR